jgi:serine/threonine-protein kinase
LQNGISPEWQRSQELTTALAPRYTDVKFVAEGGCSRVFRATDADTLNTVIVKDLIEKDSEKLAVKEIDSLQNLWHKNIVKLRGIEKDDRKLPLVVLEDIAGEDLLSALARHEKNTTKQKIFHIIRVTRALYYVCTAVEHAHANDVLHMDIKPQNIMMERNSKRPVLIDWGLSVSATSPPTNGLMRGTMGFMDPEQRYSIISEKSDVFSIGATMYTALTNELPYEPRLFTFSAIISEMAAKKGVRERNPDVPLPIARLCEHALATYRDDRITLGELRKELEINTMKLLDDAKKKV